MNRQRKKNYLMRQKAIAKNEQQKPIKLYLKNYQHENKDIENEIRSIADVKVNIDSFPKKYQHSVSYDFYAILFSSLFLEHLKDLRSKTGLSASDLDLRLGYTVGYTYASFSNTCKKPTKKNVEITFEIFKRMAMLFPEETKEVNDNVHNKIIDINKAIENSLLLNGFNPFYEIDNTSNEEIIEVRKMNKEEVSVVTFILGNENLKFEDVDDKTLKIIKRLNEKFNFGLTAKKEILVEEELF